MIMVLLFVLVNLVLVFSSRWCCYIGCVRVLMLFGSMKWCFCVVVYILVMWIIVIVLWIEMLSWIVLFLCVVFVSLVM